MYEWNVWMECMDKWIRMYEWMNGMYQWMNEWNVSMNEWINGLGYIYEMYGMNE